MKPVHDATCAVACSAEIIGSKWTALLVHDMSEGPRRFSELEHSCPGISPRTLSERLRWLEEEGVVAAEHRETVAGLGKDGERVRVDATDRLLHARDVGRLGQLQERRGTEPAPGAVRDVVHDERDG